MLTGPGIGITLNRAPGIRPDVKQILALTAGEPAGIGPDLCVQIAQMDLPYNLVVVADRELLRERARLLQLPLEIIDSSVVAPERQPCTLRVLHIPLAEPAMPGTLNSANARYVLNTLERAVEGCRSGEFDAMVTAPVHKGVINDAGIAFTGHTEYLADLTSSQAVMML
ncbi:MAG TPA: 4-hydroxythreonine-4-phosphate dehydrogenase PdxA, partial [Nitrosospira sp.]|nr:4-hydroxythreonine-4-phosphate dehydrogenase PdxA [Nitrosospira sp.]